MKFLTFGEIMLRLKAPGQECFFQSPMLEATFGGGEANVEFHGFLRAGAGSGNEGDPARMRVQGRWPYLATTSLPFIRVEWPGKLQKKL